MAFHAVKLRWETATSWPASCLYGPAAVGQYQRVLAHSWHNGGFCQRSTVAPRFGDLCLLIFTKPVIFTSAVNMPNILNIEGPLGREVLRILRDVPGVTAELGAGDRRPDVVIRAGDVAHVVELKARRATNAADARRLIDQARRLPADMRMLVVAEATTDEARRLLEDAGVALIDARGNMRVELPGIFVWTEGRPTTTTTEKSPLPPVKLTGKAGVAVQALLREPKRWWRVNDLADVAGVSVGLAHRVFARLEREQLIDAKGAGPKRIRQIANPTALLDLWAEELRDRRVMQVRAFRLGRNPREDARRLSSQLSEAKIDHALTGAAAAAGLAPFVTAIPVIDIWITDTIALAAAADAAGAEEVDDGHNIVFRQAADDGPLVFRDIVDGKWTVNPFRLYFDLRRDPRRGREQADRLRQEVIGF